MDSHDLELFFSDWQKADFIVLAVAVVLALLMAFFAWKSRRNYLKLPELPLDSEEGISVTTIIPARNEEASIARAIKSFPANEVIVVDDFSTDRTAEVARQAGARVIQPPALRRGMIGKNNACYAGSQQTDSEWLLFVDADTSYRPEFVPSLVSFARKHHLSLATVFLKQECVTAWEQMILPYAFALYFCGVSARHVNALAGSESLANGQCMLWKRSAYEFVGGHGAVVSSVIEDVELARLAKRHRLGARVLRAEHLGRVRMYDSFGAIWRGFQKNAFRFLVVNPATGFQVVLASIVMTSWLPMVVTLLLYEFWIAGAIFYFLPSLLFARWYGGFFRALLAPYAIYFFQLIALNAMVATTFGLRPSGRAVTSELIRYPVPWDLIRGLTPHLVNRTQQNIVDFTAGVVSRMEPPPLIEGLEHLPPDSRFVLVANHYQRPGLWILHTASVLTQALVLQYGPADPPIRWMVTANWPPIRLGPWRVASPGDWLLPRVAEVLQCYPVSFLGENPGYTAKSIRRLLKEARGGSAAIGVFPEGVAGSAGQLTAPLPGVDRLLAHLGRPIVPCGVSEDGRFVIRFGPVIAAAEVTASKDSAALVMSRIASLIQADRPGGRSLLDYGD